MTQEYITVKKFDWMRAIWLCTLGYIIGLIASLFLAAASIIFAVFPFLNWWWMCSWEFNSDSLQLTTEEEVAVEARK